VHLAFACTLGRADHDRTSLWSRAHQGLAPDPGQDLIRDFEGLVLQVDSVDPQSGELNGVFIRDEREAGAPL